MPAYIHDVIRDVERKKERKKQRKKDTWGNGKMKMRCTCTANRSHLEEINQSDCPKMG